LKNIVKLMILAGLVFAVAFSGCLGDNDSADNNTTPPGFEKEIKLSENNTVLTFIFDTNPTTGYDWTLTESQSGILNKTIDSYAVSDRTDTPAPGTPGIHTWTYKGETPGTVTLNFIYSRSFEEGSTIENLTYVVEVKENKSIEIISSETVGDNGSYAKDVMLENESETLKFVFTENISAGYSWENNIKPTDILQKTFDGSLPAIDDLPKAPAIHTWKYVGLKAGTATITFDCSAPDGNLSERAVYIVNVDKNNKITILDIFYDTFE